MVTRRAKRALRKITLREIGRSMGRFLSILCIVMLGAGFLDGLRVTKTAMLQTLEDYSRDNAFFDYRIVSTLGLTEDDAAYFRTLPGVEAAEGAVQTDALITLPDGSDAAVKVHSMPSALNTLKLRSGRLPENAGECVLDAMHFQNIAPGSVIAVSSENPDDTAALFTRKEYTVVGLVNSPLYINFVRGTTSLGSGSVSGFVYIGGGGLDADCYTDIYLRLSGDGFVYSDEYKSEIDAARGAVTDAADARADIRYNSLVDEATGKYDDALAKYNDGLADYEAQKAEADEKLASTRAQLDDAKAQLDESRKTLDAGRAQLEDAKAQLAASRAEYESSYPAAKASLDDAKAKLDSGWAQYDDGLARYNDSLARYEAGEAQYQEGLASYQAGEAQYQAMLGGGAEPAALAALRAQLDAAKAQLDGSRETLDASKAQLGAAKQTLDDTYGTLAASQTAYDDGMARLESAKAKLDEAQAQLGENERSLADGEAQYASGLAEYRDGEAQYADAKAEADTKFADAKKELDDAKAKLDDAKSQIDAIEKPSVYVLDRSSNTGYASFESDSDIVAGVAKVFPVFFFLVAALVCVTTMNRMVDEQRTQIGTLKSLGYTSLEIMKGYLLYTGLASGAGSALGVWLGALVFPKIIWQAYNMMYGFTQIVFVFDWGLSAAVCAAFVSLSLLVTWLSCRSELAEAPASLIRPRTPPAGKRILLERIPFLWNRFSFLKKVSARNIFRYRKRMYMMIVGIAGCTALLITGFGLNDSITGLADTQYGSISLYDAQVGFRRDLSAADEEAFLSGCGGAAADCAFLSMSTADAVSGSAAKTVSLVGTDETDLTPFMNFASGGETLPYPGRGGALINDGLARSLGVAAGDTITLRDSELNELTVTVSGVYHNIIYNYVYVSLDTLRDAAAGFGGGINAAYVNFPSGADAYASAAQVSAQSAVMSVTVLDEMRSLIDRTLGSMKYIVALVTFCAGALAFIVLYDLTNINITERIREIATIKVLGFRPWETASYVYRENLVLTAMGAAVGVPLGIWLHGYVMGNIRIDMVRFDVKILPASFALALALTLLFAAVVDFFMIFRLRAVNMAESLKSVE